MNRGVDGRSIFLDDYDRLRFIHDLFEFNDENPSSNLHYFFDKQKHSMDIGRPYIHQQEERKTLVDIFAFSIMPNHYHMLVQPKTENALPLFMKKLNMGYAKYFNEKYTRTGALFQGKYKAVLIEREAHFIHLPYYIHLNPLDMDFPEWRKRVLQNPKKALKFLEAYRWSSHPDYLGKHNFPSVIEKHLLLDVFGNEKIYAESFASWLGELDYKKFYDDQSLPLLLE